MQARLNAAMQESLAGRLKQARKARKWTQQKLAAESHVNQSDISKIERGETLRPTSLLALATALRCNPYWLDTGEGEMFGNGAALALPVITSSGGNLPSLAQALEVVASTLDALPEQGRETAAQHLQTLARAPDSKKAMAALLQALAPVDLSGTPTAQKLMDMHATVESSALPRPIIQK